MSKPHPPEDGPLFVPAATLDEAAARLFSFVRAPDPGTRGPKRALDALARSVGVEVDLAATNSALGGQVAAVLEVPWLPDCDFSGQQVTLDGLNKLLEAAAQRLWLVGRRASVDADTYDQVLRNFPQFTPAGAKQEAVDRLSDLSGVGRDRLGRGGKEHRVTFDSLASQVAPELLSDRAARRSKQAMVAALCERFSVPFLSTAGSTGQSVTLEGLNLLLAGAERFLGVISSGWATPQEEGEVLVRVLRQGIGGHWDGRQTVEAMRDSGSRHWRQMEWAGFYFEEQVRTLLNVAFPSPPVGGPRRTYGSTQFDYASSTRVWDAKSHKVDELWVPSGRRRSTAKHAAILNDSNAITACLNEQGLGFLVLDGVAHYDETGRFDAWHRAYAKEGRTPVTYTSNADTRRRRKCAFDPVALHAIWIDGLASLNAGIAAGWISQERQGAQPVFPGKERGAERNDKFHLKVHQSTPWLVAEASWPTG